MLNYLKLKKFVGVKFLDSKNDENDVVPRSWIRATKKTYRVKYPEVSNRVNEMAKANIEPLEDWKSYPVTLLCSSDTFEGCERKLYAGASTTDHEESQRSSMSPELSPLRLEKSLQRRTPPRHISRGEVSFEDFMNFKQEQVAQHEMTRQIQFEMLEILKECNSKIHAHMNLPEMPPAATTVAQLDELATSPNLVSMILLGRVPTFGGDTMA